MKKRGSPPMTPELAALAKLLVAKGLLQHEAAAVLGVNQGRISEVMTGKRFAGTKPADQLPLDFD